MIKKIICIALSLMCITSVINMPASANSDTDNFRYNQMIDMGFISGEEDPDYIVTRGEFAEILCNIAPLSSEAGAVRVYTDVDHQNPYYSSIQVVSEAGFMVGYSDGSFKPEEPVTATQVAKVFVEIAGYKPIAEAYGGYPKGYTKKADELKLFRYADIKAKTAAIKRHELGVMLHNLLIAPSANLAFAPGEETYAEKYLGLSYISDIVTANSYTNFSETVLSVGENYLCVGEKILRTDVFEDRFLVGKYISAFYDEEIGEFVSIVERKEKEETLIIKSGQVTHLGEMTVTYHNGTRSRTEKISDSMIIVYNDKVVLSYDLRNLLSERDYILRFIDNDGKDGYDIVFIDNYYTVVAGDISSDFLVKSKLFVTDPQGVYDNASTVSIDDEGTDIVYIIDADNNRLKKEDIKTGDVLTVISNTSYTKVILSRTSVKKTILEIDSGDNGECIIKCEDEELVATYELDEYISDNSLYGKTVMIQTDIYGNAAFIIEDEGKSEMCGLIVRVRTIEEFGEPRLSVKIFTEDGVEKTYISDERLHINDNTYKPKRIQEAENLLLGAIERPVLYKVTEDGLLSSVTIPETFLDGNAGGYFLGASVSAVTFSNAQKTFGGKIEAGDKTLAFILPDGSYNKDTAMVTVGNSMYDSARQYTVDGYYKSRSNDTADIIVVKTNLKAINFNTPVGVIVGKGGAGIFDGIVCEKIEYLSGGTIFTAYANTDKHPSVDITQLDKGDTVRISIDEYGFVRDYELVYDYSNERYTLSANPTSTNFNDSLVRGWGYVSRNSNGRIRVATEKAVVKDSSVFSLPMFVLSGYDLMIVENEREIKKGVEADINVGDKVVYITRGGTGKAMVIYK